MMPNRLVFIGCSLLWIIQTMGNLPCEEGKTGADSTETGNIVDYKYLLTTRYFLLAQNASFSVFPGENDKLAYYPNEPGRIGIAAFYRWFGLGLSIGSKIFQKNPDIYGTTKSYDFRINAYGAYLTFEGYFQYYQGFYMNYHSDNGKETFIIPGMDMVSIGMEGNYIYNYEKFSIRAAFIQIERQKKSAGSLVVKPSFRYYYVNSDTGFIPGFIMDGYSQIPENLLSGHFYTIGLGPGYIYSFIFLNYFYVTLGATMEVNWNFYNSHTTTETISHSGFSFPASVRTAAGYNSDKWFIGASFISTLANLRPGEGNMHDYHYSLTQIRLWVGTRFDAFRKRNKKK